MGGDHGHNQFRIICIFIIRHKNEINITSYAINFAYIDCEKETYDALQSSITKFLNSGLKDIMDSNKSFIFAWNKYGKLKLSH